MQQSDRAGRDGTQSTAFWLYQGMQLMHVKRDIKDYVKSKECRHKHLLDYFDMECPPSDPARLCCDHCSASCEFSLGDCKPLCYPLPAVDQPKVRTGGREGLAKEEGSIPAFGKRDILRPIIVYICISELSALFTSGISPGSLESLLTWNGRSFGKICLNSFSISATVQSSLVTKQTINI